MKKYLFFLWVVAMMGTSCTKPQGYGDMEFHVSYTVNGQPLTTDSLCYTNEAGNRFLVTEIQWFISNITLVSDQGDEYVLEHRDVTSLSPSPKRIFYIDTNIPGCQTLTTSSIPCQKYVSMKMTFGLDREDNVTGLFSDAPERDMFWPEPLGGGYHYMKLNGKYLDRDGKLAPMNIHLGIGQNEDQSIFYQNFFTVEFPLDLVLAENTTNVIQLDMDIGNWFCSPNTYDFNDWGSAIMQNQEAQKRLKENGHDVFSIKTANDMESLTEISKELLRKAAPKPHFMTWENLKKTFSNLKDRL